MRPILVILAASLAAVPALAQKPGADAAPAEWRAEAVRVCAAELAQVEALTPANREAICGCAADRYSDTNQSAPLPQVDAGSLRSVLGGRVLACTIQEAPRQASDVGRWMAGGVPVSPPPPVVAPSPLPSDAVDKPAADESEQADSPPGEGFSLGLGGWWESLRARIAGSGLPLWVLLPMGFIVLLVIRGLFRRDSRDDLTGPPRRR